MSNNNEFVKLWISYSAYFEPLGDAEVGRLTRAMIDYKSSGAEPKFSGNERFVWPAIKRDIDTAEAARQEYIKQQSEYGKKGGRPRKGEPLPEKGTLFSERVESQGKRNKEKGIRNKEKDNNPPVVPPSGETGFSPALQSAFESWLEYKHERKEKYQPTGLKSLITTIGKKAEEYGDQAVIDIINNSMSNNWKGIIFDRLKGSEKNGSDTRDVEIPWHIEQTIL